ncbi:MAG: NAD(+)/NADH kinase [Clostridia bacterium]|nr:NAD(+)/NADH kinase [Clostridia bacterium]
MKIALLPNLTRTRAAQTTQDICGWLSRYGAEYACTAETAAGLPEIPGLRIRPFPELMNWCDVVITVGGDGSMLVAAKHTVDYEKPILCINAGHLAFMAGLERNELSLLKQLIDGNYEIDRRMLLDAKLIRKGKVIDSRHCINDAVLSRGKTIKITDINVSCDDRLINTYRADGIIVATPTGSSGYSLSAGGPVINPSIEAIVVTPICPQSLFARSIVFSSENRIDIACDPKASNKDLVLSFDGEDAIEVLPDDVISLSKSEKYASFIRIKNDSLFEILNQKLSGTEGKS